MLLCGAGTVAQAHLLNMTEARVQVDIQAQQVHLDLQIDLLRTAGSPQAYWALAQAPMAPQYQPIWQTLAKGIQLQQQQQLIKLRVTRATMPENARREDFFDPLVWPKLSVSLTGQLISIDAPLQATFTSSFIFEEPVALTMQADGVRRSRWLISDQMGPTLGLGDSAATYAPPSSGPTFGGLFSVFEQGFLHILPAGVDHLMLVLALLLSAKRWQHLLALVTLFTLAHSVTLSLAALRLVEVNTTFVEVCILLSISLFAALALLNVQARHAYALIVPIGLLHGLGFAGGLIGLNLTEHLLWNIAAFNLGIEAAQLVFVAGAAGLGLLLTRWRAASAGLKKSLEWLLLIAPFGALISYLAAA